MKPVIWSYGGGTQSIAIAVLISQGRLPKPDCIVIADTSREASETWAYTDAHVSPLLAGLGLKVHIIPHSYATVDLYSTYGMLLPPVYDSQGKKMRTLCSTEWKQRVVNRYLRDRGYGPENPVTMWIGYSTDEWERMKDSPTSWVEFDWPLIYGVSMTRQDCRELVEDSGLPTPPRSSCWMCPHRTDKEWAHLKFHWPEDFAKAVELDSSIRNSPNGTFYLHHKSVPLQNAPLDNTSDTAIPCDSGMCWY